MKKLILLIAFIVPVFCYSQAPKKSNTIIISTSDTEAEALKKIGRILLNEGYVLETVDKDFYMLVTKMKTCKYGMGGLGNIDIKINAQIDKEGDMSKIKLTGKMNSSDFGKYTIEEFDAKALPIECCGPKSSMAGASWIMLDGIAQKYEGGEISYLTK